MLIVLEGIDGSGKGTQTARLVESLRRAGRSVATIGFPRYRDTFFGARIGEFLNGRFGTLGAVDPFLVSLLFAGDRLESLSLLKELLAAHEFVVLDRYVASNIAHQSAKRSSETRGELIEWIEHLEFTVHQLPRPDLTLLLDIPAHISRQLIERKAPRDYTAATVDLQEADTCYQAAVRDIYLDLCRRDPAWCKVDIVTGDTLRTVDEIAAEIRAAVSERCG